ncbi:HPr family phosphocarrier protein [Gracilibacillus dipsosauri]|uniref:HPr family phosphocarrier protein n=1 Tax=Gracilibacillus dipsosauri TaxID=178340 RepID=A0A317KVQ5_9BACI|nr:HPr family phosphocarrier protein [Gracilibacillus dipsosauri]PWU67591.1 HPr family phosphocarrier protein [Gracilibacillus dipsosauri]
MKEILSKNITIEGKLTIKEILTLYQYEKSYEGNILLLANHEIVHLNQITNLVSFFLTYHQMNEIKVVVEGTEVQKTMEEIEECLQGHWNEVAGNLI